MTQAVDMLAQYDREIFIWLNGLHHPWLDTVMFWLTYKFTWIPMYLFLIFITIKHTGKGAYGIIAAVLAAVILADKITSGIMKPYFARLRPCHELGLDGIIHEVTGCGGQYGFASSHASTSFALGVVWYILLKDKVKGMWLILVWAAIYSYSRIYVGVHYPGDILMGAMVGTCSAWICIRLYAIFLAKYFRN